MVITKHTKILSPDQRASIRVYEGTTEEQVLQYLSQKIMPLDSIPTAIQVEIKYLADLFGIDRPKMSILVAKFKEEGIAIGGVGWVGISYTGREKAREIRYSNGSLPQRIYKCLQDNPELTIRDTKIYLPDFGISHIQQTCSRLKKNGILCATKVPGSKTKRWSVTGEWLEKELFLTNKNIPKKKLSQMLLEYIEEEPKGRAYSDIKRRFPNFSFQHIYITTLKLNAGKKIFRVGNSYSRGARWIHDKYRENYAEALQEEIKKDHYAKQADKPVINLEKVEMQIQQGTKTYQGPVKRRIIEYLRDHPRSAYPEIARDLGLLESYVKYELYRILKDKNNGLSREGELGPENEVWFISERTLSKT